jgi:ABC-type uncharacterized transport system permease subunit
MMQADATLFIIGYLLQKMLQLGAPLVLTALGGMFSEKSGVVNIGLEGMMIVGAFSAVAATSITGNPWIGLLVGIISGGLLASLHAIVCVKFKGNHIVSGAGIILIGMGISTIGLDVVWGLKGASDFVTPLPKVQIDALQGIPILGTAFGSLSPVIYIMFLVYFISWFVLYKTPFGLRVRASGEDPSTLDTAGVSVEWTRAISVVISGCLAGLGGAYLSVGLENYFSKGVTAGRGFVSLAALIFGNWTPIGCLISGLFFGFLDGLQYAIPDIPGAGWLEPYDNFIKMLPYLLVIVALAGIRRSIPPKAVGKPYEKEKPA